MYIQLEELKKTYTGAGGEISAVNGISLTIPSNKIFGIIGKSGAGKSSLVRLISLLETPDTGAVYYDGARVDNLPKQELIAQRRKIGMIFQNFNLFSSRTAGQNVAYPLEICGTPKETIKARVAEMLELVGLSDRADAPISTLSGGQKQRVAIARALAAKPDILFCDEATSALDPQTTRAILALIREIQQKMNLTVVMITHQMEVVRDACDRVAVLDSGKLVEQGTVKDIFAHPEAAVTRDFISHIASMDTSGDANKNSENGGESLHDTVASDGDSVNKSTAENAPTEHHTTSGVVRWSIDGGKYTLRFIGTKTGEPILSRLSRTFNVEFNIRAGGIQHLPSEDIGTLITDITGDSTEVQKALDFLRSQGIIVEETR